MKLFDRMKWHTGWKVKHLRRNPVTGIYESIWEEESEGNILHDTGEIAILSAFFATAYANYGAPPANLYLGLDARAAPAEADTLASLSGEAITLTGGDRIAVISGGTGVAGQDFVLSQPAAYWRADSKEVEWTAGENWTEMKNLFLCTDTTAVIDGAGDHLVCTKALSAGRTLLSGDKLQASIYIGLSE